MQVKTLFLIFGALSLMACSSTRTSSIQAENIEVGESPKGFTLSFPGEEKWDTVKDGRFMKMMVKPGLSVDEEYKIQVLVVKLPKFKNNKDFKKFIVRSMQKSQKKSNSKVIEQSTQWVEGQDDQCIQHSQKEKYQNKAAPMLDVVSFTCRHSDKERVGVYLAYSKRYDQENGGEKINLKAEEIFEHLEMIAF